MSAKPPPTAAPGAGWRSTRSGQAYTDRPDQHPCTLAAFRSNNTIPERFADLVAAVEPLGDQGFMDFDFGRMETQKFAQRDTYDLRDFAGRSRDGDARSPEGRGDRADRRARQGPDPERRAWSRRGRRDRARVRFPEDAPAYADDPGDVSQAGLRPEDALDGLPVAPSNVGGALETSS